MLKTRDLYTWTVNPPLTSSGTPIGQAILQYEVHRYIDTRNLTETNSYLVTCTQRLIVPNSVTYEPSSTAVESYGPYPALLLANIDLPASSPQLDLILIDYFPRTLNTAVNTALNASTGSSASASQQYTSGSSTAQTNTFSTSASLGFFGDAPTGGFSQDQATSVTTGQSSATSTGTATDTNSQLSNSSAMSVKDWGSYAQLGVGDPNVTWVWGQEYPWNVIQFNAQNKTGNAVLLPEFVQQRLLDMSNPSAPVLYPPSELSTFGVDFVSSATWLITPAAPTADAVTIAFTHTLSLGSGKHVLQGSSPDTSVVASLDLVHADPIPPVTVDLPLLALDPLSGSLPAVIGFVPDQFAVAPTSSGGDFAIAADANNLLVRGSGFTSVMATDFPASAGSSAQITVYFKVIDTNSDINLSLKNWVVGMPCLLTIVVNGQSTLYRYVDAPETSGGSDNITVVSLRYKNFASVNYCDFLQMGLNEVSITITPTAKTATTYQLLAIAVG
jgi:hypothetical protein